MNTAAAKSIHVSVDFAEGANYFAVTIADTGSGIDSENLSRLFNEKFTTKQTGHGFGLVVCKRIIDAHGGQLQVDSEIGKGTKITIQFPIAQTQPTPQPA